MSNGKPWWEITPEQKKQINDYNARRAKELEAEKKKKPENTDAPDKGERERTH